jgi:hypothetical protein
MILSERGADTHTVYHELQHARQSVTRGIGVFLLLLPFLFVNWWMTLIAWLLFDIAFAIGIWLEAITNNSRGYEDNISEEHAYLNTSAKKVPYHKLDDVLDGKVDYALPRGPFTTTK